MSHIDITRATMDLFTVTSSEHSRLGVGHKKGNCGEVSATYRSPHAYNRVRMPIVSQPACSPQGRASNRNKMSALQVRRMRTKGV